VVDHTLVIGRLLANGDRSEPTVNAASGASYAPRVDVARSLDLALELADLADRITMPRFRAADLQVATKPDLTPVSEADEAVERAIRDRLAGLAEHAVVGEEFGAEGAEAAAYRWIVDPIDGTKNYVRGVPIWATMIGLEHHDEVITGVVSAPALGMRWWGARALGAFRNGDPIRSSKVATLDDAHISFAWDSVRSFDSGGVGENMLALSRRCWRTRGLGDFWQHVLVAEGGFDVSIDPIVSLWDVAALVPIVDEAGARWTTIDGRPDIGGGSFVCTNGLLHDAVIAALSTESHAG
jgi:histidinol-phosphatase